MRMPAVLQASCLGVNRAEGPVPRRQAIVADGLYHPAINDSIALRMSVSAPPDQYPTPELRAEVSPQDDDNGR